MTEIKLPSPKLKGNISVEEAIYKRRSVRDYKNDALILTQLSQLLWAGQGITSPNLYRAAPSAGATYPLELFMIAALQDSTPGYTITTLKSTR